MFKLGIALALALTVWGVWFNASPDDTTFRAIGAVAAFSLFAPIRRALWGSGSDGGAAADQPPPEVDELRVK